MRKLMHRLKWVVVGFFAVVVALLVAAYAIVVNYPVDDLKALIHDETLRLTGRELAIDGKLEMAVFPQPAIVMEGVRLKNTPWATAADMVALGRVEIEVELWPLLSGDIRVQRLRLIDGTVALERSAEGTANWDLGGDSSGDTQSLPHFSDVRLENVRVTLDDKHRHLAHTLTLAELSAAAADPASPIELAVKGRFDALPLDLKLVLPGVQGLAAGGALPVQATGQVGATSLRLEGKVASLPSGANDFRLWLEGKDLAAIAPGLPAGPFKLEALVQQKGAKTVDLPVLKGELGGATFDGALTVTTAGAVPRLEGKLHLGKLSLPVGADSGDGAGLFPNDPLPLDLLHQADAKLVLTVDELTLGAKALSNLAANLVLEHGKLSLDPLGFGYQSGNFTGALKVDAAAKPPATSLKLAGTGVPLGPATQGTLNGNLAIDLDLVARGSSPKEMAASLSGRSELSSAGGTIDSELATIASAPLMAMLRPLVSKSSGGGQARLNCLVNRMAWKDGIGTNLGTAMDAEGFTVIGNGTIDLRSETIDFYVDTWPKDTALVGLAVPVTVTGPLAKPVVALDTGGAALGIAKAAGLIVFPPAGLAAIIGDRAVAKDGNACVAAVEKVEKEGGPLAFFKDAGTAVGETVEGVVEGVGEGAGTVIDSIGEGAEDAVEGLKGLFSN